MQLLGFGQTFRNAQNCLAIDEIVRVMLDFVYDNGRGKKSVLSLALTTTYLKQPSLERLWRELDSLDPLARVLLTSKETQTSCFADKAADQVRLLKVHYPYDTHIPFR